MIDLRTVQRSFILPHIRRGSCAVDCTMGNGHDTLWLSGEMGPDGHVWAMDIQQAAVDSSEKLLCAEAKYENYTLICGSHENILVYVPSDRDICVIMFNLGWLPGGDHSKTTLRTSTLPAVKGAVQLLGDDGIILIAVYPGHPEGAAEGEMLEEYFSTLDRRVWCATKVRIVNSPTSPYFFAVEKK